MFLWKATGSRSFRGWLVLFVGVEFQLLVISHFEDLPVDLLSDPRDQLITSGRPVVIVVIEIRGAIEPEQLQLVIGQLLCHVLTNGFNRLQGPQPNLGMKLPRQVEDCQTLNIWTPQ